MNNLNNPITILIADDDEDDQLLIRDALAECQMAQDLHFVADGEELLDFLYHRGSYDCGVTPRPDLILMDLNMPRKSGHETLARIKSDPHLRHIPVVVLTTSQNDTDVVQTYYLGANSHLTKPASYDRLVGMVSTLRRLLVDLAELPHKI